MDKLYIKPAGVRYHDYKKILNFVSKNFLPNNNSLKIKLEREPENKFDSNAIKIMYNDLQLGYIPSNHTEKVGFIIDNLEEYDVYISGFNENLKPWNMFKITIEYKD